MPENCMRQIGSCCITHVSGTKDIRLREYSERRFYSCIVNILFLCTLKI